MKNPITISPSPVYPHLFEVSNGRITVLMCFNEKTNLSMIADDQEAEPSQLSVLVSDVCAAVSTVPLAGEALNALDDHCEALAEAEQD